MKMKLIRGAALLLACLLLACGLAGCKGKEGGETTTEPAATEPAVENVPVEAEKLYDYEDLSEYITLGKYKGVAFDPPSFSQADVIKRAKNELFSAADYMRQQNQDHTPFLMTVIQTAGKNTVAKGDVIVFDYEGVVEGVSEDALSSMKTTADSGPADLEIGSGRFISGFEDQVVGKQIGKKFEVTVTFPEIYNQDEVSKELEGKEAVFTCTIHKIGRYSISDANAQAWAQVKLGVQDATVDEFYSEVKLMMEKEYRSSKPNELAKDAAKVLKLPEAELQFHLDEMEERGKSIEEAGYTREAYLRYVNFEGTWAEYAEKTAGDQVTEELYYIAVARAEGLETTTEDLAAMVQDIRSYWMNYGYDDIGTDQSALEGEFQTARNANVYILQNKVTEFVAEKAAEKE